VEGNHVSNSKGPHIFFDNVRPFRHGVEEDGTKALDNGSYKALRDTILPVSSHGAKGETPMFLEARIMDDLGCIDTVVSLDTLYGYTVSGCKILEFVF
jgi:hypothetical protein